MDLAKGLRSSRERGVFQLRPSFGHPSLPPACLTLSLRGHQLDAYGTPTVSTSQPLPPPLPAAAAS